MGYINCFSMSPLSVQFLAKQQLNFNFFYCLVGVLNQANLNIRQEIIKVSYHDKFKRLVQLLNDESVKSGRTIIFMNQRRRCETFAIQLGFKFGNRGFFFLGIRSVIFIFRCLKFTFRPSNGL